MATAFLRAVSAIGLKTTAFLQSLFLFPFNTILRPVVQLFPNFCQTDQPILPCSTTSGSPSSSSGETRSNNGVGDGGRQNDSGMAPAPSASTASAPVPDIVPALPRAPLTGKENQSPTTDSQSKADTQLSDSLSRLGVNEQGPVDDILSTALANGNGSVTVNGTEKQVAHSGASFPQHQPARGSVGDGNSEGVTQATPAASTQTVFQTSGLKEAATTMQLDGVTVHVKDKAETPEQAAERAMHSRFMREALDMVGLRMR